MSKRRNGLKALCWGFIGGFGYQLVTDIIEKEHHSPAIWAILIALFVVALVGAVLAGRGADKE